jgi:hypothetical protein
MPSQSKAIDTRDTMYGIDHRTRTPEEKLWHSTIRLAEVAAATYTLDQLGKPPELRDQGPQARLAFMAGQQVLSCVLTIVGFWAIVIECLLLGLMFMLGIQDWLGGNPSGPPLTIIGFLITIPGFWRIVRPTWKLIVSCHRQIFEKQRRKAVSVMPANQPPIPRGVVPIPDVSPQQALPRTTGTRHSTTKPVRLTMTIDANVVNEKDW